MGKSYESHILILNFEDSQIIHLKYALQSPVEISCIEFHPENAKVLIGGSINGQLIIWDLGSTEHRIEQGRKKIDKEDEEDDKGG